MTSSSQMFQTPSRFEFLDQKRPSPSSQAAWRLQYRPIVLIFSKECLLSNWWIKNFQTRCKYGAFFERLIDMAYWKELLCKSHILKGISSWSSIKTSSKISGNKSAPNPQSGGVYLPTMISTRWKRHPSSSTNMSRSSRWNTDTRANAPEQKSTHELQSWKPVY